VVEIRNESMDRCIMLLEERCVTLADTKKFWRSRTDDVAELGAQGRYETFSRFQEEIIFK
jgi:hypothetical protein